MIKQITVLFSLSLASLLLSQEEYRGIISSEFMHRVYNYEFHLTHDALGARALAMGGTGIAAVNDLTALSWNPANLTNLKGFNLLLDSKMSFNSQTHNVPRYTGIALTTEFTPLFNPDYAAAGYTFSAGKHSIALALSYHPYNDLNWKAQTTQYSYGGGRVQEDDTDKGGIKEVTSGLAVDVLPFCSVGFNFDILFGSSDYNLSIVSPYADKFLYFKFSEREQYSGSSFDIGIKIKPVRWFTVAARLSPEWDLAIKKKKESYNMLDVLTMKRTITQTAADSLSTFTFTIPLNYGIGIAFNPVDQMTIAVDVDRQQWSQSKVQVTNGDINPMLQQIFDTINWRAGLEYRMNADPWFIPLRIGFLSNQTPYKDKLFKNEYLGKQVQGWGWSFGFGLNYKKYIFDFAFVKRSLESGWWMMASDYYNHRMFSTQNNYNEIFLSFSYQL